jgi:hypothetical protein
MTRIFLCRFGLLAASLVVAAASAHIHAQSAAVNKRTFLTFNRAVQVPGATLPAGTYLFRIANPNAQTIWQILDEHGRHILATFYFVSTKERTVQEINRAGGKPVVRFHETPQGVAPAMKALYYPTEAAGSFFLYPRAQAEQIAAVTHQPVLATDSDPTKSPLAHVITIQPDAGAAPQAIETVERSR